MSDETISGYGSLPPTVVDEIDQLCDDFEKVWRAGGTPTIEDYLGRFQGDSAARPLFFRDLLDLEIELRRSRGDQPSAPEYAARFPEYAVLIKDLFAPASTKVASPRKQQKLGRNLLFGMLALQNNFVGRDALLAAFNTWVADKSKGLGIILEDAGAISPAQRALLDALVAEHLKQHRDDVEESIVAVSSAIPDYELFTEINDPDVHARIGHIRTEHSTGRWSDISTKTYYTGDERSARQGGRFRILKFKYKEGGMGIVSIASDQELNREVALKEIKEDQAGNPVMREKFVVEAEVTGGLEHPAIVPVYGLGKYDDGRPHYAMRLIKDDHRPGSDNTLRGAIRKFHEDDTPARDPAERSLALRELLGRFLDICDAVSYAHHLGILHRDLKPINIILGRFGETFVLDWGLTKGIDPVVDSEVQVIRPLRPESAGDDWRTWSRSAEGTIGYMSPEQAAGNSEQLRPTSDVYGLGAILYTLLTDKASIKPNNKTLEEEHRAIADTIAGKFPRPREVKPNVSPALEKICLKAMETEPAQRYQSVRALAEDIKHWLADEPVSVCPETRSQRLARWARRHRARVQAAAASLVLVALITSVATLLIGRAYSHERKAREAERKAKENAEAHFANAREATNDLYQTASKVLPKIPVTDQLRSELAIKTAQKFDKFLELRPVDRVVQREAARAQRELGNVSRLFGKFDRARNAYTRAVTLLESLVAATPADPLLLSDLIMAKADQGELLRRWGKTSEARAALQSALALCPKLRALEPGRPEALRGEAYVLICWSPLLLDLGREMEAVDGSSKALRLAEQLGSRDKLSPATLFATKIAILADGQAGMALRELGKDEEAMKRLNDALKLAKGLVKGMPPDLPANDPDALALEAAVLIELGELVHAQAALEIYQRAFEIMQKLQREHPGILGHSCDMARALNGRGRAQFESKEFKKARLDCEGARELFNQLRAFRPDQPNYRREFGRAILNLGRIAHAKSDDPTATNCYRQASGVFSLNPESVPDQRLRQHVQKELEALTK